MKKFDWKKVLILVFALVLVFSLAACNPSTDNKKKENKVPVADFLNTLVDGVSGYVSALGAEDGVRHIDTKLVVQVGTEGKAVGTAANYEIHIAANFDDTTQDYTKNDAMIEVKNLNDADKNKVVFGLYASEGKVYIRESVSTPDGAEQQLKIEDITAFQYNQYLAKIPGVLNSLLKGMDLKGMLGESIADLAASVLDPIFTITKEGNQYKAELKIDQLNTMLSSFKLDLKQYRDIINLILPSVLGLTLNEDNSLSSGATNPTVTLNVNMDDKGQFNGLTFDYTWPEKNGSGNGVSVNVGLTDITINNTSKPVTEDMKFDSFKDGALKVHANVNVPGLTENGFKVEGDFYLKPGFATIDGSAASENEVLKVELVAKKDGALYPLLAQYKYEEENGVRIGRLYFDIGALTDLAGIENVNNTKFFVNFDIAEFLIGAATPTQETFEIEGLPEGYSGNAIFKTYKNKKYYIKNKEFADGILWAGTEITTESGTVGTDTAWGRIQEKDKEGFSYIDVILTVDSQKEVYRISVTDSEMLKMMNGENVKAVAVNYTRESEQADSVKVAVYDADNNKLETTTPREDGFYYTFQIFGQDGTFINRKYYFYMATPVGSPEETVLADEIGNRLQNIFIEIEKDLTEYANPGFKVKLAGAWGNGGKDGYNAYDANQMLSTVKTPTLKEYNILTGKVTNRGLFQIGDKTNFKYEASLVMLQEKIKTSDELYNELVANDKLNDYINNGMVRVQNGTTDVPAITSDIQVNNGTDFAFDINGLGGLVSKLLEKVNGLTDSGSISISLNDAKDILNMGAYLNSNKLFAAQIRMLLSNEKQSDEFKNLAVYAPFMTPVRTVKQEIKDFKASSQKGVVGKVSDQNTYLKETVFLDIIYKIYGTKTADQLKAELGLTDITDKTTVGLEGWTNANVDAYDILTTAKEKAEYYFKTMRTTYKTRVEKHDAAYAEYRKEMEAKALKAIRGYIGANGSIPESVDTVEKFLFDEALTITLDFGKKNVSIIDGMPLSVKISVKRGSSLIAEFDAGVQLIDASKIPTNEIPDNYWSGAVEVSTGASNPENYKYADVVILLLKVHAHFAGFGSWMDIVGINPAA